MYVDTDAHTHTHTHTHTHIRTHTCTYIDTAHRANGGAAEEGVSGQASQVLLNHLWRVRLIRDSFV